MHDRAPHCVRRQCEAHSRDIPETWPRCAGEDVCCAGPVRRPQQLVPTDPGQQRAASRDLEERSVEVGVERPEQPVAFEKLSRHRPDAVELLTELESHPVVEVQMSDDELLPVGLRRAGRLGENVRDGDRSGSPSRRAAETAAASTAEESRPPEKLTKQGPGASAGSTASRSASTGSARTSSGA